MISTLLSLPQVYDFAQYLIRGTRFGPNFARRFIKPKAGDRILDVGCGTGAILHHLPGTHYVGFDMSKPYVAACNRRFHGRGSFHCEVLNAHTSRDFGQFDIVLAVGVLHHLNEAEAAQLFRLAKESLVEGGRLITLDGVFHEGQSRLVQWLLRSDRGKYVRTAKGYLNLAEAEFNVVNSHIVEDLFRIPYTLIILQCRR